MRKLFFVILIVLTFGYCSLKPGEKITNFKIRKEITSDTCSFCFIDSLQIRSILTNEQIEITIDYPVVIEFFDLTELIFENQRSNYDTLLKKFGFTPQKMSNEIYFLTEQYNYYTHNIRPYLSKKSVTILDSVSPDQFLKLKDKKNEFIVDLKSFKRKDGVLMFNPGKLPILWTMKRDETYCFG